MSVKLNSPKAVILSAFLLSIALWVFGFVLAYRQDAEQVAQTALLAQAHLKYARDLKDDMGIIDWSKNLEKIDSVLAFKVTVSQKVLAQGGNQNFISEISNEGVFYSFPSTWSFHSSSQKERQTLVTFDLVIRTWPGPLLWGLLPMVGAWCVGGFIYTGIPRISSPGESSPTAKAEKVIASAPPSNVSAPFPHLAAYQNLPFLFIDSQLRIQEVSPSAAGLLQKKVSELKGKHLIDLSPDPMVMQIMEKGESGKISKPFLSHPEVTSTMKVIPEGFVFLLEKT